MSRDGFKCCDCNNTDKMQNIHHKYYTDGKKPWEYPDDCLITLCEDCHKKRHEIDNKFSEFLQLLPNNFGVHYFYEYWQQHANPNELAFILAYVFDAVMHGADEWDFYGVMEEYRGKADIKYMEEHGGVKNDILN